MSSDHCISSIKIKHYLLATATALGLVAASQGQTPQPEYRPLPMTVPFSAFTAAPLGHMAAANRLSISISMDYRDPAGMQDFVDSVSDPTSPNYRKFLTPAEIGKRFGPTPETIEKVKSFLTNQGLDIKLVGDNGLSILADGTVQQIETAFKTQLFEYASLDQYVPSGGHLYSYLTTPSMPADVQPYIVSVGGLESFTHPKPMAYLTPPQVQTLYNIAPLAAGGTKGVGRTIGISNWDGFRLSNVSYEYNAFGLSLPTGGVLTNITVKTVSGGAGAGTEQGEGDLDIQTVLGVAPQCKLIIYDGGNSDIIGVLTLEANDNLADVITESYGWLLGPSMMTAAHNLHLAMSAAGITYMSASGDSGTTVSYYYPNIDPEVLSVGGTTCTVDSTGKRISEVGWSGSGGGWKATTDSFNVLPSYQVGTGVPKNINYRLFPDVALDADPSSGYVVYITGKAYVIGGTSGASPTFAGCLGIAEQQLIANGAIPADSSGHYRLGRVQDVLYSLNGDPTVFYDVTSGSNGTLPNSAISAASTGWDFVTGWGPVDFNGLVTRLSGTGLAQFTIAPSSIEGGVTTSTGTVSIVNPAPTGGTTIAISGGDSKITYPATVTVAAGARTATFSITSTAVSANVTETLTATLGSKAKTATLVVTTTPIASLAILPSTAVGGTSFNGVVTLTHAAPSPAGDVVTLSGGDSHVSHPATVTVLAGATTATFNMTSEVVAGSFPETISATLGSSSKSAQVTITGPSVASLTLSSPSVIGGTVVTGTVTLSSAAGANGTTVTLSGGDSSVSFPGTVVVPALSKSVTFKVTTYANYAAANETLKATLLTSFASANLTVNPVAISSITLAPNSVFGGASSTGTITLNGAAGANGLTIAFSGGDSSISYPAKVTVAAGAKTATFTITTSIVQTVDVETITATTPSGATGAASATTSVSLTVKPAGVVSTLTFSPTTIIGGNTSTGTVTLTGPAGPQGVTVSLSGGDSSITYPSSVTVASGSISKAFVVTSSVVATNATESLTATIGPSSAKASLVVSAPTLSSFALAPTSVFGGVSSTGTVTITGAAPSTGLKVSISGGDSSVSYPATVTVASGAKTATFTVTTSAVATNVTETLKASIGTAAPSLTASLAVKPAGVVGSLTFSPASLYGGTPTTGTIALTGPAGPQGVTVTLSGGDSSITYPSSVTIPAGAATKTFGVTTTAIAANASEVITAAIGPSSAKGTIIVTAPTVASVVITPSTVFGGVSATGTVNLTGPAPKGGNSITLTGGDSNISYPAKVTVPEGTKSASFTVTTSIIATAIGETIKATLASTGATAPSAASATLTIKPAGVMASLVFLPTAIVGGSSATGTITLTGGAGPLGVVVSLSGGDSSVGYPSTITIPAGMATKTFTVTSSAVSVNAIESFIAAIGPSSAKANLTISAATLSNLTLSTVSAGGGAQVTGTLMLSGPAPSGGLVVQLAGGDASWSYPATVTIPQGQSTTTFAVTTLAVTAKKTETLTATLGKIVKTVSLSLRP